MLEKPVPLLPVPQKATDEYAPILEGLRKFRRPLSTAPTAVPKNFTEMIQFYENGSTRRLYIFVNTGWRYVALT